MRQSDYNGHTPDSYADEHDTFGTNRGLVFVDEPTPEGVSVPDTDEWCGVDEHTDHKDDKGRTLPEHMSDRALLIEAVTSLRHVQDGMEQFSTNLLGNPMIKGMLGL